MKVKDLLFILGNLDSEMDVKMYLFSQVTIIPGKPEEIVTPLRVDCYNINDVLISSYCNSVLLSSLSNFSHKV